MSQPPIPQKNAFQNHHIDSTKIQKNS